MEVEEYEEKDQGLTKGNGLVEGRYPWRRLKSRTIGAEH